MQLAQVQDVDSLSLGTNYWAFPHSRIASPVAHEERLESQFGQLLGWTAPISRKIPFVHERKAVGAHGGSDQDHAVLVAVRILQLGPTSCLSIRPAHSVMEVQPEQTESASQQPGRKDRLRSPKVESRGRPSSPRDHSRHRSNPLADIAESAAAPPRALEHPPRSPC
jgi:hypothetical protein